MAAGLTHPHILPVHDSGEANCLHFYVMPSMEGHSLRERLDAQRQLCLERAFQARSAGLIYLHLDPGYAPLRADPRFADLVRRIGLR